MRSAPFTRPTLIAAVELLEQHSQARFNQIVLRLGLEDEISSNSSISVAKKRDLLGRIVVQRADAVLDTLDGRMTLGEAVVRQAALLAQPDAIHPLQTAFARGLARDAFVLVWDDDGRNASIRAALPGEIQLPETDDEVHRLLKFFAFMTPLGHLDQAVEAHTRGDWAACNGQLRTFLESLFDDIASNVRPEDAAKKTPTPKIAGRCWRKSASYRQAAMNGPETGRTTSMAFSRCCTPKDRTPVFRTRITALSVSTSCSLPRAPSSGAWPTGNRRRE